MQSKFLAKIVRNNFLIIFSFFLFFNCSPSGQLHYIAPEYKNLQQSTALVMVMPFITKMIDPMQREILIDKKNEQKKPLTDREIELFENYISPLLAENTYAKIVQPDNSFKASDLKLTYQVIQNESEQKVSLFIPTSKQVVYKGETPDYLLLFEDLYFLKDATEKGLSLGRGTSTSYSMNGGIEYLLWDNKKGKVAAYGKLYKKLKLLSVPSKEDYMVLLENFASSIIANSPLSARKIYF